MQNEIVTYEVKLNNPLFYTEFKAEASLTEDEILTLAIEDMTRCTEVRSVKSTKRVDRAPKTVYFIPMQNEIFVYEVQLDNPLFYTEFKAEAGLTEDQILTFAIEEMTRCTKVRSVKTKKIC